MTHRHNDATGYQDCLDCETECRSDNPCDCCDEASQALSLAEDEAAPVAAEMGA